MNNQYIQPSIEQGRRVIPEPVERRLKVTETSAKFMLAATQSAYNRFIKDRASQSPAAREVVRVANQPEATASKLSSTPEFPLPTDKSVVNNQQANTQSGEVVNMDSYRMAEEARRLAAEARGDSNGFAT